MDKKLLTRIPDSFRDDTESYQCFAYNKQKNAIALLSTFDSRESAELYAQSLFDAGFVYTIITARKFEFVKLDGTFDWSLLQVT